MLVRKNHALFSNFWRNNMKNNLRIFGLALCMLPMSLHAGTEQDVKQASQPTQEQNAGSAATIPASTILPVSLNATLRSDKSGSGATIIATVMQDVPLGKGETLRKGSKVIGHVVEAITPGKGSDKSKISFQFDQVQLGNQTISLNTSLRAIASRTAVIDATPELTSSEYADETIEIGGDQISYGEGGSVMVGSQVVGKYTSQGVLANVASDSGILSGGTTGGDARPQAFWLFSVNARGAYGFSDLTILQSGRTEPIGEVTLASNRKAVRVDKGSAMLLRVDGSGPESVQARTTPSRQTGQ
jgi:hypothetical protein